MQALFPLVKHPICRFDWQLPMKLTPLLVSDSAAAAYERDGYVVVPELLSPAECDELKVEALRVMREHANPKATVYVGAAAASARFYRLADDSRILGVLRQLMPNGVMFLSDKLVFKSATQKFPTPWHIDYFYWRHTRPKLSVWIPLDDSLAANGTLKVVPGSHTRDWNAHQPGDLGATNHEFGNVIQNQTWPPEAEVTCELKRGGAIFFSDRLAHASCPNTAGLDRYAIISTYHAPADEEPFDRQFPARHLIAPPR
jgi:ectoine hydroxylase-related dioxygenase (phytanoyl-CoA dioxygenase family)